MMDNDSTQNELKCALAEIQKLQDKIIEVEKNLFASKEENKELYHKLAQTKEIIDRLQQELATSSSAHMHRASIVANAADNDIDELQKLNTQLETENSKLLKKVKELQIVLKDHNENSDKLSTQDTIITQQKNIIKNHESSIKALELELGQFKKDCDSSIAKQNISENNLLDMKKLQKKLESKSKECDDYQGKIEKKNNRIKSFKAELKEKEAKIAELTKRNEEIIDSIIKMSRDLIDLKNREKELLDTYSDKSPRPSDCGMSTHDHHPLSSGFL